MIEQPLHLVYASRAIDSPTAWLLPSADPAAWLAEVCRWDVDQTSLRFLPLPKAAGDLSVHAVLVTLESGRELAHAGPQCLAYRCLAKQLFLPVEAKLQPAVSETELSAMLTSDYRYVWHPALGLIAFEPHEVLSLADLIGPLSVANTDWSLAQPGIRFASKIVSLEAAQPPGLAGIFGSESEEIGSEGEGLDDLPRSPGEPGNDPLSKAARQGGKFLAGMAGAIGGMAGKIAGATPGGSAWYERMQHWAEKNLGKIDAALQFQRNKEVNRLLDMLRSNPDEGLKYALPMGGGAARGMAPPGGILGQRNVNFSLSSLGGGGPADYWHMDYQYQQQLIQQYHELAGREIRLGRHRRAAYIYAHLLGDLNAAAETLASGGHYREAAVLYKDKLGRPLNAAECLEKGGLWSEAIDLYEEQQQYEKVGDLHRHLEQETEAVAAYEKAIGQYRSRDDYLTASIVYESKLNDLDSALTNLADAWPYSGQASQCVRKIFEINAREGRHDDSRRWIEHFRNPTSPQQMHSAMVKLSSEAAVSYPDSSLQHFAADTTRVLIARELPKSNRGAARELLDSLRHLTPGDRLLASDTRRYIDGWEATPPPKAPPRQAKPDKIRLKRVVHFGRGHPNEYWRAATWSDSTIYGFGFDRVRNQMLLARANWMGVVDRHRAPWKLTLTAADHTPAATAGPATLTFGKAIIAPKHDVEIPLGDRERDVRIVFQCFPYLTSGGDVAWFEET